MKTDQGVDATQVKGAGPKLLLGFALALTLVVYSETPKFQFVHDDLGQIIANPAVHSWRYVPRYFTEHVWAQVYPGTMGNYYRPVFLLWLRVNYLVFGAHAWGWHLTSVLAHVVVTLLVYFLAARIAGDRLTAAMAALVFGLHPVHIEAVAWISGVTEPLLGMLLIPAFLCYLKKRDQPEKARGWLALSLLLYALAMLAKETALVLPMIVMAYEWVHGTREKERAGWRKGVQRVGRALWCATPYFVLIPPYMVARILALKGFSHTITILPLSTVILTWPSLLWFYLKLLVWPVGLSAFYDTPYVTEFGLSTFLLPAVGLAAAAFLVWVWSQRPRECVVFQTASPESRAVRSACVWMVLPVLPLLNLPVFAEGEIAHDRYLYLPSVGYSVLVALALRRLDIGRPRLLGLNAFQVISACVLACLLAVATLYQSLYWADDLLLYSHGASVALNNSLVKINLANAAGDRGLYPAAIRLYREVIQRNPGFWLAYYNLGYTYYRQGNLDEADRYLSRAIEINVLDANEFLYLGLTRLKLGRLDEAEALIRRAIEKAPAEGSGFHFALGVVLKTRGDLRGALNEFEAERAVSPELSAARQQIAEIRALLQREQTRTSGRP